MALEEKTHLASIEVLFPSGAINARWDTVITRDGEVISGPNIHRRAYSAEELDDVVAAIEALKSKFQEVPQ
jgi:hypothetical protein